MGTVRRMVGPLTMGVVAGLAVTIVATAFQNGQPPLVGREEHDPFTAHVAGVAQFVSWVAALAALGCFVVALVMTPHRPRGSRSIARPKVHHALSDVGRRWTVAGARLAQVWFAASVIGGPFVASAALGVPVGYAVASPVAFLVGSQVALLWFIQALVALAVVVLGYLSRTMGGIAIACYLGVLGLLPSVVATNVSVGLNHDLATDAALLGTLAVGVWIPTAFAVAMMGPGSGAGQRLRRYQWISLVGAVVVAVTGGVITWQGLAGHSLLASPYGVVQLTGGVCVGLLLLNAVVRLFVQHLLTRWVSVVVDLTLAAIGIGLWIASNTLPPPRFTVPQSSQVNYLGYSVDTPPTFLYLISPGRPNILFVTVAVVAIVAYLVGHWRIRRQGGSWPVGRTIVWVLGWVVVLGVSATGLWAYSAATFSIHMVVHMTTNMLAPVLIVMGAPITLALRAFPAHRQHEVPGPREVLSAVLAWKPLEYILHPLAVWLYFVTAFYLLYFTPLFDTMMRYHWAHQFMTVHFLFTGLLFYGLVIGEDRPPKPLPHVGKIGFMFAAMPFHAFFAVGILSAESLLAPTFYPTLDVAWVGDLLADQRIGGQITWATGEIPMLIVIIALVIQWFRQDTRDSQRLDRAQDAGLDDSLEAYNEMLQQLADRDARR